ncbi:MAG: HEPN domain-containing protein [Nanobdellota archaeon]
MAAATLYRRCSMDKLAWCRKKGIKLIPPNENLAQAYLKKAYSSLNMLTSAIEKKEYEWMASTAYYARYFAVYALMMKCGIQSEIHDCTLHIVQKLFRLHDTYKKLGKKASHRPAILRQHACPSRD